MTRPSGAPHHAQKPSSAAGVRHQGPGVRNTNASHQTPQPGTDPPWIILAQHTTLASELPQPTAWAPASLEAALPVRPAASQTSSRHGQVPTARNLLTPENRHPTPDVQRRTRT